MKIKWILLGALILVAVIISLIIAVQKPSYDAAMKDYREHMQSDAGFK